ncbi:MAG TPA: methyltransferase domain-containing protein [Spirochaetota bacterium]|nr:methyltransferase domain-containing protein [Spirochaetota bacterium]HPL18563.1 methyltransferase domain-containing protein [Spirochaetota bacterium]HRS77060.1 methyltransferase domain-containing protein [Spirochaetota bacterium]HRT74846.1 methyltransferase domain-containing protein [Spirochaetota bacterium]
MKATVNGPLQARPKGIHARKSLGPVANLEEYVNPEWWSTIFNNALRLKTDADVAEDHAVTVREVDLFIRTANLLPDDRILDLSCGQGRHSLELARRGFKFVEGLDRSRYLIQRAKMQAKKDCLNVKFREGEARMLPYRPDTFDVIFILGNSFGYFETVNDDLRVLREVFRVLKPWGRLLIDVNDGDHLRRHFQPRSWDWIDKNHFVCRERSLSVDKQRLISREVVTHVEKGVIADQFYAERLYNSDSMQELLNAAGFSDIALHGDDDAGHPRGQDPGMTEKRIIMTALVKKDWSPVRQKKTDIKNVTVVLGDPMKRDPVRPAPGSGAGGRYAVDQMKDALKSLPDYNFTYISSHDSLINDLSRLRKNIDFVFNLCDDGYNNEARKELHVPSLLEMMDISYTGSGPQCIAYCYDKSLVRGIAKEMGIPVAKAFFIKPEDTAFDLPFGFPVICKPNFGDSSFGITQRSVCNSIEELVNAISEMRDRLGYEKPILVEEFLTGKDLSAGIIGNPPDSYRVLPLLEEDYSLLPPELPKICGYETKWVPDSPYRDIRTVPAVISDENRKLIIECCLKLFERLECRDYCRFDWRLDGKGKPKLLEVNPNPGWCRDGHMAKMAKLDGLSYADMMGEILQAAEHRIGLVSMSGSVVHCAD